MGRFALALAAIVILMLSAGPRRGQPQAAPLSVGAPSATAFHEKTDAFRAEMMLMNRAAIPPTTQRSPNAPAPSLRQNSGRAWLDNGFPISSGCD